MRFYGFLILGVVGLVLGTLPAAATVDPTQVYVEAHVLPPSLLPPPPEEGSAAWRKQTDAVIAAQKGLTQADLAPLRAEQNLRVELMTPTLGPGFTREKYPKTFALLDRVTKATAQVVEADKKYWHTRRPYLTDAHVKLYVDRIDDSPAYPSGHTATSCVWAEVLGQLAPEKQAALRARADAIARHRIEAGVHYPVDIEGGRLLAMAIVGALQSSDFYQDDLAAARKELSGEK